MKKDKKTSHNYLVVEKIQLYNRDGAMLFNQDQIKFVQIENEKLTKNLKIHFSFDIFLNAAVYRTFYKVNPPRSTRK